MSASGFTRKKIDLTITLGTGQFGDGKGDSVTLSGLRMTADLINAGGETMGAAQVRVYGMSSSMMNKLTVIGYTQAAIRSQNTIQIAAGDDESGMKTIFIGTIYDAWADYNSAPEVAFNILGNAGLDALVKPVGAISFKGETDVAGIMQGLASKMGLTLENGGVNVKLSNPYFPGTALAQMRACARAANINATVDCGILKIWSKNGALPGPMPLISPDTGMVGYPTLNSSGMSIKTLFLPDLRPGREVEVQSSIPMACGIWRLGPISHSLSSEIPGGPWFTTFQCAHANN